MFSSGSPLVVQVRYRLNHDVNWLVCGLAFHRSDGLNLAGPNTVAGGMSIKPPPVGGTGSISYEIPALPLLAGNYRLTVNLYDQHAQQSYDYVEQGFPFKVIDDVGRPGLVDLGGRWSAR